MKALVVLDIINYLQLERIFGPRTRKIKNKSFSDKQFSKIIKILRDASTCFKLYNHTSLFHSLWLQKYLSFYKKCKNLALFKNLLINFFTIIICPLIETKTTFCNTWLIIYLIVLYKYCWSTLGPIPLIRPDFRCTEKVK